MQFQGLVVEAMSRKRLCVDAEAFPAGGRPDAMRMLSMPANCVIFVEREHQIGWNLDSWHAMGCMV